MSKFKTFVFNTLILTLTSILISTIVMIFNIYIANKIGDEGLGVFKLVISVYLFFVTIANSGINLSATKIVAEELAIDNKTGAKSAAKKCIIYSLFIGVFACITMILLSEIITNKWLHGIVNCKPIYILAISLPFLAMSSAINGYFSGTRKVSRTAISQIIGKTLEILVSIFALNFFKPSNIQDICVILVTSSLISEFISFIYLYIVYRFSNKKEVNKQLVKNTDYDKRILKIAVPVALTSYIRSGLSTLKQILIPLRLEKFGLSCATSLGKYGIMNGMVMPILLFPNIIVISFSNLLIPEFAYFYSKKNYTKICSLIEKIFKPAFIFSFAVIGVFLYFGEALCMQIYNNAEAGIYLKVLAPLALLIYIDFIIDAMLKGLDKQFGVMLCNIFDLIVTVSIIYLFLPVLGINGYIISIYVSEIINFTISIYQLAKATKFKLKVCNLIVTPIIATIASSCYVSIISSSPNYTSPYKLILHISIFLLTYFLGILLADYLRDTVFKKQEKK